MSEETERQLNACVYEVVQNVADHASSPVGAVIGARFMPPPFNQICVAVVDLGIGIATSLRKGKQPVADAAQALQQMFDRSFAAVTKTVAQ